MNIKVSNSRYILCVLSNDPCSDTVYEMLPHPGDRYVSNVLDRTLYPPINDAVLKTGWYRVIGEDMPTSEPPAINRCGTRNPIWLSGTLPGGDGEIKDIETYIKISSSVKERLDFNARVKNCGNYRVYLLQATLYTDSAYCFGNGEDAKRPSISPLFADIRISKAYKNDESMIKAGCIFNKLSDSEILYEVSFFINDAIISDPVILAETELADQANTFITHPSHLNKNISCKVTTKYAKKGPRGPVTISPYMFLGIQLKTSFIRMQEDNEDGENITLKMTAPLVCPRDVPNCNMELKLFQNGCEGVAQPTECGVRLKESDWDKEVNISVKPFTKKMYKRRFTSVVFLHTIKQTYHPVWIGFVLPSIQVQIDPSTKTAWEGKRCDANNDPHMKTFDERYYDIQYEGEFLMYRHRKFQFVQVQVRFNSCSRNGQFPFCVCGAAIQSGGDVFIVHRCGDTYKDQVQFRYCEEDHLKVIKKQNTYQAFLPTGANVEIQIYGAHITVSITPSYKDYDITEGLCGNLNGNCKDDFTLPNGNQLHTNIAHCPSRIDYNFQPNDFSKEWQLSRLNLFSLFQSNDDTLVLWDKNKYLCRCVETGDPQNSHQIDCSSNEMALCEIDGDTLPFNPYCKVHSHTRRKRSWTPLKHNKQSLYHHLRRKRSLTPRVTMTEAEATEYCDINLKTSTSYNLCSTIPNVNPEEAIVACVTDIMISNSTVWLDSSRESLKSKCIGELKMNRTLQEADSPNKKPIAGLIKEVTCPNECSGQGQCLNGTCHCNEGIGLSDCSIDLRIPPDFYSMLDGGLCDVQEYACNEAVVSGDDFAEEANVSCMFKDVMVDIEGNMTISKENRIVPANVQTLMSLLCPLPKDKHRRNITGGQEPKTGFVSGFSVSLSNDGKHFGDEQFLFIFDSLCQSPTTVDGNPAFLLKDGFCYIGNKCIKDSTLNPTTSCEECNPTNSKYEWSVKRNKECGIDVEEENLLWVIGAVLGTIVGIVVVALFAFFIRIRLRKKKVGDSLSSLKS